MKSMCTYSDYGEHMCSSKKISIKLYEELCSWDIFCLYIEGVKLLSSQCGKKKKKEK